MQSPNMCYAHDLSNISYSCLYVFSLTSSIFHLMWQAWKPFTYMVFFYSSNLCRKYTLCVIVGIPFSYLVIYVENTLCV